MIREQDLNLTILRASLGTTAQHDPYLSRLRFMLPGGPVRPLLPSLTSDGPPSATSPTTPLTASVFDTLLVGTTMTLSYNLTWPLDLFLDKTDLSIYSSIFSFLSALRKTHTRVHTCWTSLSNAQRARRRWTGFGEGGTVEDLDVRAKMLRCGWGVVRNMSWFLDTLLGYVMTDVVDTEFRKLKESLGKHREGLQSTTTISKSSAQQATSSHLDFTTLRTIHTNYLGRLVDGCLLSNYSFTSIMRQILDVCERFVAVVERWGGDVLPALLFEGSIMNEGEQEVGAMVKERWALVAEIDEVCI
jgi:gamma-tubulin complex component 4